MKLPWLICTGLLCAFAGLAAEPQKFFYLVESNMQMRDGRNLPPSVALIRRVIDRSQGTIEESVITLRDSAPAQEFITIIKVEGRKAKISCSNCEIEGEGEFVGEAWEWTGFKFKTKLPSLGQVVEGEDRFLPDGMSAEKRILAADGRPSIVIKDKGQLIAPATYNILRARVLAK